MPMPSFDAIVIGGGTNGLACAARLRKSGRNVLVLDARVTPGGAAVAQDFAPGYRAPSLAHIVNMIDPRVEREMDLGRHGLAYANLDLASTAVSRDGDHLVLHGAAAERVAGLGASEQQAWADLRAQLLTFADVLAPFKSMTPPRIAAGVGNEYMKLGKLGFGIRRMGKDSFREFLRMLLINVHDVLNDDLSDPRLKGILAHDAVLGTWLGPRSPNSLIHLLNRFSGQVAGRRSAIALPKGGMGSLAAAMATSAGAIGVTIRTGAMVGGIVIEGDRAVGVTLADGEEIRAGTVVSAIGPKPTFLNLVGAQHLDTGFVNRVRHMKSRGGAAKLHLALKAAPDFRGADLTSRLVLAPSETAVELSFNAVKYSEVPENPVMEVILPSAHEEGHAPSGRHVLSAIVQFAPHAPKDGPDAARARMLERTLAVLEDHATGIRGLVEHAELLMPYDIEARYGMAGGNWHHGELSVEQMLFLRPFPGMAQYATPIPGLWLAGAGCHPGGGISGAAGWNAAERIVKEVRA
ncbi:NAD(P)/FAD-dependent oxidoreductase [Defluviimonas sp. WL0002]|uniref:Pyridine nucleotide-disulfide oxidoreductase domain-containing protein 2 n=1 Tax=Albidovulum marisflavi TaxID=2984159 RepID=A0ABT2Z9B0_9RHOB|nr:NAD(P)/FAD-dependent oxidoreductase [Defluviimonas sp. WL0002]MCV2867720.1 NAD(P)/FAD-dependent oxidoreductase [Defluviimonas sp. WL0002]